MQFETIHPFLDGNGRIGRLLIVLQLVSDGLLREPLLYPSLFFKTHRALYYELLNDVRLTGDWERWLDFFAEGVAASAAQAVRSAQTLPALVSADRDRIAALGRAAGSALPLHQALQRQRRARRCRRSRHGSPNEAALELNRHTNLFAKLVHRAPSQCGP